MAARAPQPVARSPLSAGASPWVPFGAVGLAIAAAVVAYVPALRNGFVWDDPLVLQQLRSIHALRDLLFLPPIIPKFYYRPLVFVSYLLDRSIAGEVPYWFHASVIAVHALNTLLVAIAAQRLLQSDWLVPACAALLFAVHPIHTESVAWMAGRSDVLVCFFMLLTLLLALRRGMWWACAAGATYFLALSCKEMAVAALLLVPLADWLLVRKVLWVRYVPLLIATALYFYLRQLNIGAMVGGASTTMPAALAVADVLRAIGVYAVQTMLPMHLSPYVPQMPDQSLYLLAALAALGLAAWASWRAWRSAHFGIVFLIAWYFVTLAPSLVVILRRSASAVIADRYLYVPSVAACILLPWAVSRAAQRWKVSGAWALGAVALLALVFTAQTQSYARVWNDNFSFWSAVVEHGTSDALPNRELGIALMERGQFGEAESALRQALLAPADAESRVMTYSNLGSLYRRQARLDEAIQTFDTALQIAPHPGLYHNLGMTLMSATEQAQRRGDQAAVLRFITQARDAFEHALAFENDPNAAVYLTQWEPAKSHALLGQVLFSLGERQAARQHLETSLRLQPSGPIAETNRQYLKKFGAPQ